MYVAEHTEHTKHTIQPHPTNTLKHKAGRIVARARDTQKKEKKKKRVNSYAGESALNRRTDGRTSVGPMCFKCKYTERDSICSYRLKEFFATLRKKRGPGFDYILQKCDTIATCGGINVVYVIFVLTQKRTRALFAFVGDDFGLVYSDRKIIRAEAAKEPEPADLSNK